MRNEAPNDTSSGEDAVAPAGGRRQGATAPRGATVSIPARDAAALLGPATLRARLALLRPQPVRLDPAEREN
jgi:hypothetical protein